MIFVDYYKILDVHKEATIKEIVTSYRKMAKIWHPDINASIEAEAQMKLIIEAKLILSDQTKRSIYDKVYFEYYNQRNLKFEKLSTSEYERVVFDFSTLMADIKELVIIEMDKFKQEFRKDLKVALIGAFKGVFGIYDFKKE